LFYYSLASSQEHRNDPDQSTHLDVPMNGRWLAKDEFSHASGRTLLHTPEAIGLIYLRFDPQSIIANGGYEAIAANHFWPNCSITDITPNYPAPQKGKTLPPPGNYAKSRDQFVKYHEKYVPKFFEIFGNVEMDGNKPSYGYRLENDCLTYHWENTYLATLLKNYG
jgi:hypothetical protein